MSKFHEFVENPSGALFLGILEELAAGPDYRPYARQIEQIHGFLDSEEYEKAFEACQLSGGTLLLSPEVHMLAGYAARKLGDEELFNMERAITAACIRGILDTGDGTKENPYVVPVTSDEYFILEILEKKFESQALLKDGDRHLDLMRTTEGDELYFDISRPYENLQKQFSKKADEPPE